MNSEVAATVDLDVHSIRADFPILNVQPYGQHLAYFDNAATTQKPRVVIDTLTQFYEQFNSNVHRGVHYLSQHATEAYEKSRDIVRQFLNAQSTAEIVFVRGTTEALNLLATSFGKLLQPGDEILISMMEHHSNLVPWQILAKGKELKLKYIPITETGELDLDAFERLLSDRTRVVSVVHASNSLGTVNPIEKIIDLAHQNDIPVIIDGAQAVAHLSVDVQNLDADFYVFSGHKIYGPTGIGILYGKERWLDRLPPYQAGGDMIKRVTLEETTYNVLPYKFEAGTPNIAGAVGLGVALEYVQNIGLSKIARYEAQLLEYATQAVEEIPGLRIIGTANHKIGVLSFVMDYTHPHDIGTILDQAGVAIRAGHHCTQPVMDFFGVEGTARASFAVYNTTDEIDQMVKALWQVYQLFGQ